MTPPGVQRWAWPERANTRAWVEHACVHTGAGTRVTLRGVRVLVCTGVYWEHWGAVWCTGCAGVCWGALGCTGSIEVYWEHWGAVEFTGSTGEQCGVLGTLGALCALGCAGVYWEQPQPLVGWHVSLPWPLGTSSPHPHSCSPMQSGRGGVHPGCIHAPQELSPADPGGGRVFLLPDRKPSPAGRDLPKSLV